MLVLDRRVGEEIVIAGNITVKVVDIKGNHARLGITAPREIPAHRREVQERIDDAARRDEEYVG